MPITYKRAIFTDPSGKYKGRPKKQPRTPQLSFVYYFLFKYPKYLYTSSISVFFVILLLKIKFQSNQLKSSLSTIFKNSPARPKEYLLDASEGLEDICPLNLYELNRKAEYNLYHGGRFIKPDQNVRSAKYLLPILGYGRTNQLRSLSESIIMAIYLNRTLVVPPFFIDNWADSNNKEDTDNLPLEEKEKFTKFKILDPHTQINLQTLRKLIKIISWRELQDKCPNQLLNTIFIGHGNYCHNQKFWRLRAFQDYTNFNIIKSTQQQDPKDDKMCEILESKLTLQPTGISYKNEYAFRMNLPYSADKAKQVFSDDKTCAAYLYPVGVYDLSTVFVNPELHSPAFI